MFYISSRMVLISAALLVSFGSLIFCKPLSPVILVSGDGGNRMEYKLNNASHGPFSLCPDITDTYRTIWVNIHGLLPGFINCLVDNFRLVYNRTTRTTSYPKGVDIRVPGFGETDSVEWLSKTHFAKLGYYHELVENLVKWGYVRNKSVRGAPYDFRKSPNELGEYYNNLTKLVEDTYSLNNNTKVTFIAHSLGNLVILFFLNHKPQAWKDKYISSFITLAAPWGGSVKILRLIASGDNIAVILIKALTARPMQRSMTSSAFLMPSNQFWKDSEVLIETPRRNYTVKDYKSFFYDLNFTDGYMMREDTRSLVNPLKPPNVEVHCLYGYGLDTAERYVYTEDQWPDKQPKMIPGNGDKTVSIRSLRGCLPWKESQKQPFSYKEFEGIGHIDILKHSAVIDYLRGILI